MRQTQVPPTSTFLRRCYTLCLFSILSLLVFRVIKVKLHFLLFFFVLFCFSSIDCNLQKLTRAKKSKPQGFALAVSPLSERYI